MTRRRTRTLGSTIATALKALALVSVARTIGPRRIGRLAALAAEGYLIRRRAREFRRIRGTLVRFMS